MTITFKSWQSKRLESLAEVSRGFRPVKLPHGTEALTGAAFVQETRRQCDVIRATLHRGEELRRWVEHVILTEQCRKHCINLTGLETHEVVLVHNHITQLSYEWERLTDPETDCTGGKWIVVPAARDD